MKIDNKRNRSAIPSNDINTRKKLISQQTKQLSKQIEDRADTVAANTLFALSSDVKSDLIKHAAKLALTVLQECIDRNLQHSIRSLEKLHDMKINLSLIPAPTGDNDLKNVREQYLSAASLGSLTGAIKADAIWHAIDSQSAISKLMKERRISLNSSSKNHHSILPKN